MHAPRQDAAAKDLSGSLAAYPGPVLILAAPDEPVERVLEDAWHAVRVLGAADDESSMIANLGAPAFYRRRWVNLFDIRVEEG